VVAIISAGVFAGLRINLTPSEPLGLWRIVVLDRPVAVGDLVFVCPPPGALTAFGLARGYFRQGTCPGGVVPLIKTVAAIAGASITVGVAVTVDGIPLPHSELSPKDGQDRTLMPWVGGIVPSGQLFLHSTFRGSYDSRYFGPVPEAGLLGLARPVLTVSLTGINGL
jgi:conjugative transfer signal peptidase TraF